MTLHYNSLYVLQNKSLADAWNMAHDASFGIFKVFESDVRVIRKKEKLLLKLVLNRKWAHVFYDPLWQGSFKMPISWIGDACSQNILQETFKKAACILILSLSYFIKDPLNIKTISLLAC